MKKLLYITFIISLALFGAASYESARELSTDGERVNFLTRKDNSTIFVIRKNSFNTSSSLRVAVTACDGRFLMHAASSLEKLNSKNYDIRTSHLDFHLDQTINVKLQDAIQEVYINFELLPGKALTYEAAIGSIEARFVNEYYTELACFPGDNGEISYHKDGTDKWTVSIEKAHCASANNVNKEVFTYQFARDYDVAQISSRCPEIGREDLKVLGLGGLDDTLFYRGRSDSVYHYTPPLNTTERDLYISVSEKHSHMGVERRIHYGTVKVRNHGWKLFSTPDTTFHAWIRSTSALKGVTGFFAAVFSVIVGILVFQVL